MMRFGLLAPLLSVLVSAIPAQIRGADGFRYHVTGNTAFSASTLVGAAKEELRAFEESQGALTDLEDAADRVRRHYVAAGFPDARVESLVDTVDGVVHAQLVVREGPTVAVHSTTIAGANAWTEAALLDAIDASALRPGATFVRREARREAQRIEVWYHQHGYRFASVMMTTRRLGTERVAIDLELVEGDRYRVGAITVRGNGRVSADEIRTALAIRPGGPATPWLEDEARGRSVDFLARRGFPFAEVEVTAEHDATTRRSAVEIVVQEGPLTRIGAIEIKGNVLTRQSVIESRLRLDRGALLTQQRIWDSQTGLQTTGLFDSVKIEHGEFHPAPDAPDEGVLDLSVGVEERAPWKIEVYGGYGSYERIRGGVTLTHLNVFGSGRSAELGVRASLRNRRIETTFVDGITFGRSVTARISASGERRALPSYDLEEFEATAEIQVALTPRIDTRFGFDHRVSEATDTPIGDFDPNESIRVSQLRASVTWDLRSDPIEPRSGALFGASYEFAHRELGGELDFHRAVGSARFFVDLGRDWVLALAGRGGVIVPFGETDEIPIQERFFNGGESSVRSFKWFDLGPRLGSKATGGEAYLTLNTELRYPIYRALAGTVFVDAGNVRTDHADFGLGRLQYGVGGGLHLRTPVGPIRIDVGHNPDPDRGDDHWVAHISVGYAF